MKDSLCRKISKAFLIGAFLINPPKLSSQPFLNEGPLSFLIGGQIPEIRIIYVNQNEEITKIFSNTPNNNYYNIKFIGSGGPIAMTEKINNQYNLLLTNLDFSEPCIHLIPPIDPSMYKVESLKKEDMVLYSPLEIKIIKLMNQEKIWLPYTKIVEGLKESDFISLEEGATLRATFYAEEGKEKNSYKIVFSSSYKDK